MSALVNTVANQFLDSLLGTPGLLPATVYIGLMTAEPNPDGTGVVEPSGNGYARVGVANSVAQWPAASSRQKSHASDIVFAAASGGSWGTITHVGIFDAVSGGNLKCYGALDTPRLVNDTDVFRFLSGTSPLTLTA